jgi:hypothetical protein
MRWLARLAWTWWLCCALAGCGGEREARWLELSGAEPGLLESGTTLRIAGHGFPVGERCEVRFDGRTQRPGTTSVAVNARLSGRALTEDVVEVVIDDAAIATLGARGSFDGEIEVAFRVHGGEGAITGALHERLDVSQAEGRDAARDQALRERAQRVLGFAGIVAADEESTLNGLVLAEARARSPAEALGLQHGDVIVEIAAGRAEREAAGAASGAGPHVGVEPVVARVVRARPERGARAHLGAAGVAAHVRAAVLAAAVARAVAAA